MYNIHTLIESHRWKVASSMPTIPHEYTLKEWWEDKVAFEWFVMTIRNSGYQARFWRKVFIYLHVGPYKYWTMGAPLEETILVNRAIIQRGLQK